MIKSVNELFVRLDLTESLVLKMSKANTPPKWKIDINLLNPIEDQFGVEASLTIEDGFLEGVVTEFHGEDDRDIAVSFLYDLTESVPILAEGVLQYMPSTNQHAMLAEFARQVELMGARI